MNTNHINELLDKYFEGESSIAEEKSLKAYFNSDEVADEHLPYSDLFNYFSIAQTEILEKELNFIDLVDLEEPKPKLRLIKRDIFSIAAAVLLLISAVFIIRTEIGSSNTNALAEVEIEDPEVALETTMEALAYLGVKLHKGTEEMEKIKTLTKTQILK